jgi:threonine aldolase
MREAMLRAEVGDVVYDEDPTVRQLEADVARLLGKPAALYVATGTMANTLAIRLCAQPGDEILAEVDAHPLHYEAGGSAAFSGVLFKPIRGKDGILHPEDVAAAIYPPVYYRARQVALLVENTHNRGGGTVYPLETLQQLGDVAREHGLRSHLDGARLWNASVASGVSVADMAAPFDTVSVCFSKALGAPVGSVLAGSAKDIQRAWHYRHMLGGSWRQAGILAAGALYALEHNVQRLADDHGNAQYLATELTNRCGLEVLNPVQTNMVYFRHPDAANLCAWLQQQDILVSVVRPGVIRCVTHLDVDRHGIQRAADAIQGYRHGEST